jgi:hypothetical protein
MVEDWAKRAMNACGFSVEHHDTLVGVCIIKKLNG